MRETHADSSTHSFRIEVETVVVEYINETNTNIRKSFQHTFQITRCR